MLAKMNVNKMNKYAVTNYKNFGKNIDMET